jgi:hypothetical protein
MDVGNRRRAFLLIGILLGMTPTAHSQQLSAGATVLMRAEVRGSVTVSATSVPLSLTLDAADPAANYAAVPLLIRWNLNPAESRGFRVIGYFRDPSDALRGDAENIALPSSRVLGRVGATEFRPFIDTNEVGPAGASLLLFEQSVTPGHNRGSQSGLLELRIDDREPAPPNGNYRGTLFIEVQQY